MIDQAVPPADTETVVAALRDDLARGDAVAGTVAPILRHLVAAGDVSVFSEEILARVRAMLADLAIALLDALVGTESRRVHSAGEVEVVGRALLDNPALLTHLHSLALEWQLTERMQARLALDPVMSPLLQGLLPNDQGLAAAFVGAQARWCQAQRQMKLALRELPAELLNVALYTLRMLAGAEPELAARATVAETEIRASYDEASSRMGLAAKLVAGLGDGAWTALVLARAGVPLFLTAIAQGSGQNRDAVVLSTHEAQIARLALALRAAGLEPWLVEEQILALHSEMLLPEGFERIGSEQAATILSLHPGQPA
ncbi:hypothetical protein [Novosphingobium sp. BL-52-GroH]|uniref:hypothetical protein n=1 Tax=Novosphingobium sp. BL-52-GroH TaxID=3349877 RepID=UPI00384FBDB6